jgi:hypothetical protein
VRNPDPGLYREAETAFGSNESYRGFVSRGRIAGRLRQMLGGSEWDFRKPYLAREEAERFRRHVSDLGVDARWDGETLVIVDPRGRWRPSRMEPNRHGLYQIGAFGRAVRPGSGFERDWEEVTALPRDHELDPHTIASALDTGLPLGPAFDRITSEVDVPTLIGSLSFARTDYARERICILLAHHPNARESAAALEAIVAFVDSTDLALRRGAAYAIKTIVGRVGSRRVEASTPDLATGLQNRLAQEDDHEVRDDITAALGALGQEPPKSSDAAAASFIEEAKAALDFLVDEYSFDEPTVEDAAWSTSLAYRNETTGVVASADWHDDVAELFLVKLHHGALPLYLDTELTHWISPSFLAHETEDAEAAGAMPNPRSRADIHRFLTREAAALRLHEDVLRGDFTRFDRALSHLRGSFGFDE